MIITDNTAVFTKLADLFEPMYLTLENKGYDLAELDAFHVTYAPEGSGNITLLFDAHTMEPLTFNFKKGGKVDLAVKGGV